MRTTAFDKNVIIFFVIFNLVFISVLIVRAAIATEKCPEIILLAASSKKVKTGEPITFTDKTTGVGKREWNFGDNSEAQFDSEVTHAYKKPGEYTVTLKVNGLCDTSQVIVVSELVLPPQIMAPKEAFAGEEVQFAGIANNAEMWQWYFDEDDIVDSRVPEPTYEFGKTGSFTVKLRVNNNPGLESEHVITIKAKHAAPPATSAGKPAKPTLRELTKDQFRRMLQQVSKREMKPEELYEYICDIQKVKVYVNQMKPNEFGNYIGNVYSFKVLPKEFNLDIIRNPGKCISEIKIEYQQD